MAWKIGAKLIFAERGLICFPVMKNKKAIFLERCINGKDLIFVRYKIHKKFLKELWHKDYWCKRK